jgi:hypothetical protein
MIKRPNATRVKCWGSPRARTTHREGRAPVIAQVSQESDVDAIRRRHHGNMRLTSTGRVKPDV